MDPNAALAQIRATVGAIQSPECIRDEKVLLADDLAEQVKALDEWMSNGGFKPNEWEWGDDT